MPIIIPRTLEIEQQVAEKGYAKVRFEHLKTAFKNPHKLQGMVTIWAGDEKVFHVEDGEVIKDSLNLISNRWIDNLIEESLDIAKSEVESKDLIDSITAVMEAFGKYNPRTHLLYYETRNYIFNQEDEKLKVIAKNDGREVLNNSGFTKAATDRDIAALQTFKGIAEELAFDDSQTQRPSLKP